MFDYPYYPVYPMYDFYGRAPAPISYIRVFHACPDAPPVDVYANGILIAKDLAYRNFTQYLPVPAGKYSVRVFPAGQIQKPVLTTDLEIPANTIFTVAAIGKLANLSLLPIQDSIMPIQNGRVMLRFGHLSPNAPNVDVTLPDGTVLFKNVGYKSITKYLSVFPGKYELQLRVTGTDKVVLKVPNIHLLPNRFYTVYAIGLVGGQPPLQVVIPLDGNSYIKF